MNFVEGIFLPFLVVVLAIYWKFSTQTHRKVWLLLASLFFYGTWDYRFLGLLVLTILVDFTLGIQIDRASSSRGRKAWLVVSLVSNLGILATFKYLGFLIHETSMLLSAFGWNIPHSTLEFVLPLGISFYTFQSLSYVIDVYRREIPATRALLDYALFVSFFPHLIAGPLVRAGAFLPQLAIRKHWERIPVRAALLFIASGYLKKSVLADNLAVLVDPIFSEPLAYGSFEVRAGVLAYSLQIYFDFAGYSEMARGLALLFGIEFPKNFSWPYLALGFSDFWRRWHMTLGEWFRNYVYISLGGNRRGGTQTVLNLALTMGLCGLWHGADSRFLAWGMLHGALLGLERWVRGALSTLPGWVRDSTVSRGLVRVFTFSVVTLLWVIFRAPDFRTASEVYVRVFHYVPRLPQVRLDWFLVVMGLVALVHVVQSSRGLSIWTKLTPTFQRGVLRLQALSHSPWVEGPAWGLLAALLLWFTSVQRVPFIYFQF